MQKYHLVGGECGGVQRHTPGPWEASSPDAPEQGVYGCGYRLVKMTGGEIRRDVANARLISAAPELLEALLSAITGLEVLQEAMDVLPADLMPGLPILIEDARAAVAKAQGGAA